VADGYLRFITDGEKGRFFLSVFPLGKGKMQAGEIPLSKSRTMISVGEKEGACPTSIDRSWEKAPGPRNEEGKKTTVPELREKDGQTVEEQYVHTPGKGERKEKFQSRGIGGGGTRIGSPPTGGK